MNTIHIYLRREDHELIVAVADHGSISRAAESLHLTQSAVSHHLKNVERALGRDIFTREPRRTLPTSFGRECVHSARMALRALRQADTAIAFSTTHNKRVVTLGTECYTSYHWLPKLTRAFRRSRTRYELRVAVDVSRRILPALLEGEIDLALLNSTGERSDVTYVPLLNDEIVLVVPEKHRLAQRPFITPEDLEREELILHDTPSGANPLIDHVLEPCVITPRAVHRVQLTEAIIHMVAAGWGVSALARWMIGPYVAHNRVKTVRIGRDGLQRAWRVAFRRADPRAPELGALARSLALELKRLLPANQRFRKT